MVLGHLPMKLLVGEGMLAETARNGEVDGVGVARWLCRRVDRGAPLGGEGWALGNDKLMKRDA